MALQSNQPMLHFELVDNSEEFRVSRLHGSEGISQLYDFQLELVSENQQLDLAAMLGQACVITVEQPLLLTQDDDPELSQISSRYIHGVIRHFAVGAEGPNAEFTCYHALIAPKIYPLSLNSHCRIYQNKTVIAIVSELLDNFGLLTDEYRFDCQQDHPSYPYCVQYRETDLNFMQRLLEQAGIFYYFEHQAHQHVLVFSDDSTALDPIELEPSLYVSHLQQGKISIPHVQSFEFGGTLTSDKVVLRDYNFQQPNDPLHVETAATGQREVYDYPGGYLTAAAGERSAKIRLQALNGEQSFGKAESNVNRLMVGFYFELVDEERDYLNGKYLVTQIEHVSAQSGVLEQGATNEGSQYNNRFRCIKADHPYCPPQITRQPIVEGLQSAVVVGPAGEAIYTNEHGQVKVQFHWDRLGASDQESSCWVRVSQMWAGNGYGSLFLPRIGHEVLVDFLEGDPNRPIIVGSVYHGVNRPPNDLPANKTQSMIRTQSTPGGQGCNELRFEDKQGQEQIFIQAQRDQDIHVKNNHFERVDNQHHLRVGQQRYEYIKEDQHHIVGGDSLSKIKGSEHKIIETDGLRHTQGSEHQQIDQDRIVQVNGSDHVKVAEDVNINLGKSFGVKAGKDIDIQSNASINLTANRAINIKVGGNFISINATGVTIKGSMIKINSGGSAQAASPGTAAQVALPDEAKVAAMASGGTKAAKTNSQNKSQPVKPSVYSPQAKAFKSASQTGVAFTDDCEVTAPAADHQPNSSDN